MSYFSSNSKGLLEAMCVRIKSSSLNRNDTGGISAAATTRPSAFRKLNVAHACSVFRTSTFILYFRMNSIIFLVKAGVVCWPPIPKTRMSIFGSSAVKRLKLASLMSSWLSTFHERTDRGKMAIGPITFMSLLNRKPSWLNELISKPESAS